MNADPYYPYSEYLKKKYGKKVYKLPIKLDITCPNRDGHAGIGGCIFCNEKGGSFENLSEKYSITQQLEKNREYIKKRYKAECFIAYFQNFSNTYMPLDAFKKFMLEAAKADIVAIQISTRPDCIHREHLDYLQKISDTYKVDIVFELGVQTVNNRTLKILNRGHSLSDTINAIIKIKKYGFEVCTHMILGLPWDDMEDVIEGAKILSLLETDQVKIHSLYIPKNTELGSMYKRQEFELKTLEQYKEEVKMFLRFLDPNIAIQRIVGRMPEEDSLFCNWDTSWWKIRDDIVKEMQDENISQGDLYNYKEGILCI